MYQQLVLTILGTGVPFTFLSSRARDGRPIVANLMTTPSWRRFYLCFFPLSDVQLLGNDVVYYLERSFAFLLNVMAAHAPPSNV